MKIKLLFKLYLITFLIKNIFIFGARAVAQGVTCLPSRCYPRKDLVSIPQHPIWSPQPGAMSERIVSGVITACHLVWPKTNQKNFCHKPLS